MSTSMHHTSLYLLLRCHSGYRFTY